MSAIVLGIVPETFGQFARTKLGNEGRPSSIAVGNIFAGIEPLIRHPSGPVIAGIVNANKLVAVDNISCSAPGWTGVWILLCGQRRYARAM